MSQLHHIDTGSQVSSIVWNTEYKELVSGHGFSQNQLTVWKYPTLSKVSFVFKFLDKLLPQRSLKVSYKLSHFFISFFIYILS